MTLGQGTALRGTETGAEKMDGAKPFWGGDGAAENEKAPDMRRRFFDSQHTRWVQRPEFEIRSKLLNQKAEEYFLGA